jgi:hypothetical protein
LGLSPLFFALFSGAVIVRLFFSLLSGGEKHLGGDRSTVLETVLSLDTGDDHHASCEADYRPILRPGCNPHRARVNVSENSPPSPAANRPGRLLCDSRCRRCASDTLSENGSRLRFHGRRKTAQRVIKEL